MNENNKCLQFRQVDDFIADLFVKQVRSAEYTRSVTTDFHFKVQAILS